MLGGGSFTGPQGVALTEHTDTRSNAIQPNFRMFNVLDFIDTSPGGRHDRHRTLLG
jgi:hypothetical protein